MSRLLDEIPAVTDRDAPALAVWNALTDLWTQVQDDGVKLSPLARAQFLRAGAHACEASNREGRGAVGVDLAGMQAAVDELRAQVASKPDNCAVCGRVAVERPLTLPTECPGEESHAVELAELRTRLVAVEAERDALRAQLAVTVTCEACDGRGENPRYTPDGEDDGEEACAPCSGAGELSLGTIATARIEARRRPAAPEAPTTTDDEDLPW